MRRKSHRSIRPAYVRTGLHKLSTEHSIDCRSRGRRQRKNQAIYLQNTRLKLKRKSKARGRLNVEQRNAKGEVIVDDIVRGNHEIGWIGCVECQVLDANNRTSSIDKQSACVLNLTCRSRQIERAAGCPNGKGVVLQRVVAKIRDDGAQTLYRIDEAGAELHSGASEVDGRSL